MKIRIGETIKNLRTQQHITQEQLAEALEVSPQAVSRWENATTFPDISVLPVIANYFDVTTDYLLGVDAIHKQKEIDNIIMQNQKLRNEGKTLESVLLLREKVKEYPNNARLLYELASSLFSYYYQSGIKLPWPQKKEMAWESVEMCKRALMYNKETWIADCCKQLMVFNYVNLNKNEMAAEIANTLTVFWCCREMVYPRTLKGRQALLEYQCNLLKFLDATVDALDKIRASDTYTDEQKLEIAMMREKLIIMIAGENPCFYNDRLFDNAKIMASLYAKCGKPEQLPECLEKCLKYAHNFEKRTNHGKYDTIWLSECEDNIDGDTKHTSQTLYDILLEFIVKNKFDELLKGNERFEAVMEELKG